METTCIEKHRYCNRNERAEWIARYRSSGLRPPQFAEQHGLKLGTLRNWIQKEAHESSLGRETTGFQELLLPSVAAIGPWAAEVQLPDGVGVYQAFGKKHLRLAHWGRSEPLFASRRTEPADPWLGRDTPPPVVPGVNYSPRFLLLFAGLRISLPAYFPGERRFAGARPTSNGEQPAGDPRVAGGSSGLEPAAIVRGAV